MSVHMNAVGRLYISAQTVWEGDWGQWENECTGFENVLQKKESNMEAKICYRKSS